MLFSKNFLIGKELVNRKYITQEQLDEGLILHQRNHIRLGKALIELGYISEDDLVKVVADQLSIPYIDCASLTVPDAVLRMVPKELVKSMLVVPVSCEKGVLTVCVPDPLVDNLKSKLEKKITEVEIAFAIASTAAIRAAIERFYSYE